VLVLKAQLVLKDLKVQQEQQDHKVLLEIKVK
jgi:hypothetical protein